MNKKHLTYILVNAKKLKSYEMLGGKCQICGESNYCKLEFHHNEKDYKEFQISKINKRLNNVRSIDDNILKELLKCDI